MFRFGRFVGCVAVTASSAGIRRISFPQAIGFCNAFTKIVNAGCGICLGFCLTAARTGSGLLAIRGTGGGCRHLPGSERVAESGRLIIRVAVAADGTGVNRVSAAFAGRRNSVFRHLMVAARGDGTVFLRAADRAGPNFIAFVGTVWFRHG